MPELCSGILFYARPIMKMKQHPIVLFDGVCNFCNGAVNFLIRQDVGARLRFAALQSAAGQQLLQQYGLPQTSFASFVLIKNGQVYQKSDAVLQLIAYLPWYWQWPKGGALLPTAVRNGLYDFIARNRYKWFGQKDSCMVPTAEIRSRFL